MTRELRRVPTDWTSKHGTEPLLDLPTDPTTDEYWYARHMLSLASSGAMFHGRFVEVHLARLLGAHLPMTGINDWDLLVPGTPDIHVEVKTSTSEDPSFKLSPFAKRPLNKDRIWPRVWIFVYAPDRDSRSFTYFVAPDKKVGALGASIGLSRVKREFTEATEQTLLAQVRKADATN